jgi:hypothetical protein
MQASRHAVRLAAALAGQMLLAGTLGTLVPAHAAAAEPCKFQAGGQPPGRGTESGLDGVTVLTECDAWAVGDFTGDTSDGPAQGTLIEHWDGSRWKIVPSPDGGTRENRLDAVSAASPTSIWAVGWSDNGATSGERSLILHWDGHDWTKQDSPSAGEITQVRGVSAVSPTEAWAVGVGTGGPKAAGSLILHFTGGKWHIAHSPVGVANLQAVTATSATGAWAVGTIPSGNAGHSESLILHWNGRNWTRETSPNLGEFSVLFGIDASSPSNAIAVGAAVTDLTDPLDSTFPLIMHWNGHTWNRLIPAHATPKSQFNGVAVTSPDSARVIGSLVRPVTGSRQIIELWDGKRLTLANTRSIKSGLVAIAASSASNEWAVGVRSVPGGDAPYALHFG